ncbi:MAG: hypothetical protein ACRYF9_08615 [Janthinobacterium lividum]
MTAITSASLPLTTSLTAITPITSVPAATTLISTTVTTAADSPAAVVSLGNAVTTAVDLYSSRGTLADAPPALMWENTTQNKVTSTIAGNLNSQDASTRFKGLGAALLTQFANSGSGFSQSVLQPTGNATPSASALTALQSNLHANAENAVSLTIKTASGATVTLSLSSSDTGLGAQVSVTGGKLNDSELAAVSKLADGFQSAIDGLGAKPPKLNLDGLTQFDKTALTSVDFTAKLAGGDIQTLSFSSDANKRSVSMTGVVGDLNLSVDTRNTAILGNAAQQAKALQTYLTKFDSARARGHGDEELMSMFKDAFTTFNTNVGSAAATTSGAVLSDTDHAMLTGLADFSASISQHAQSVNPMRTNEVDTFAYTVSQSTQAKGAQANRSIDQQQQSQLSASYHQALYPGTSLNLTMDKDSQNYTYFKIADSASSSSSIAYSKNAIISAALSQSSTQSKTALTYVLGQLQSTVTTPKQVAQASSVKDLLEDALKQDKASGFGGSGNGPAYKAAINGIHERVLGALDIATSN